MKFNKFQTLKNYDKNAEKHIAHFNIFIIFQLDDFCSSKQNQNR